MTRRRHRGGRRRGPRRPHEPGDLGPVVYVDDAKIVALVPFIRHIVRAIGVSERYIPDVVQEAVFGAWRSMLAGRFRMREGDSIDRALRAWITSIAINHARNWQERAFYRREIPFADLHTDPDELGCGTVDPWPQHDAREALRIIARSLPWDLRVVAALATIGYTTTEIALALGLSYAATSWRLRRLREWLRKLQAGRGGAR